MSDKHYGTRAYARTTDAIVTWALIIFGVPFLACVFLLACL